jgi:hypothetical protein
MVSVGEQRELDCESSLVVGHAAFANVSGKIWEHMWEQSGNNKVVTGVSSVFCFV